MSGPRIIERPSPNQDVRTAGTVIDMLVLHYTGMRTAEEALLRLCDPDAKVSAHYTIDRKGDVYAHVPEQYRSWHAGISWWAGERDINSRSIGIELVNPGHEFGYVPFPDRQIAALIDLSRGILSRHAIAAARVLGHSDIAPARKEDPGELFPWGLLAQQGIGVWPRAEHSHTTRRETDTDEAETTAASLLARFGYGLPPDVEVPLTKVITAFQRHFRPQKFDGIWDSECGSILTALLAD